MAEFEIFNLGDFGLQSGFTLRDAFIAYKTVGDASNPAIVYPTWYSGLISDNEWLIGEDKTLNPKKYFIIIPALFGNSQSTSPSNTPEPRPFPSITMLDNVTAQYRLVTEKLGVTHLKAVLGWSMGAAQTFQWITQYPDFMDLAIPFCGAARCSLHNQVFLEGVKSALVAAKGAVSGGTGKIEATDVSQYRNWTAEEREIGLKALGRVYAGWGFSQTFYREKVYETHLGFKDLDSFMVGFWEANMMTMLGTWQSADCSKQARYKGDFELAMKSIKAKTLVLPSQTDLYFPPEDSDIEVAHMSPGIGKRIAYPSIWGHWAGGPGDSKEDVKWLDGKLKVFFETGSVEHVESL
ncbi:Alpha/Beta hydrolase protein [Xylaria bambusicola]|uniref:Alpha/Beta hydrolase protein n=1 Tax=Xylaria bambusicola TaxID=326684 RepID=UPI0020086764|nr:Alpha/Beta hydrolase protein [Xylaria bambusicola]KAI0525381.1 Alpha/Beta hydrolase protein [Xylaria bambusicola]